MSELTADWLSPFAMLFSPFWPKASPYASGEKSFGRISRRRTVVSSRAFVCPLATFPPTASISRMLRTRREASAMIGFP